MDSVTAAFSSSGASHDLEFAWDLQAPEANRKKQVSSVELIGHVYDRIERHDPAINAFVYQLKEDALARAGAADEVVAKRDPLGVFHGVPILVKESFAVAGHPCTWGIQALKDSKAPRNAVAVDRLLGAGAIIVGATNVPVNLQDWQSFNPIYGTTNNPWDLKRTPGGSSGGSAAALAAGYVPLELGSDLSASLRVPAHLCGVFAHKPTSNLVPQRGHAPPRSLALETDLTNGLGVCGPMARTTADLSLALDVIAGPDDYEAAAYRLQLRPARHNVLKDFRALVLDSHPLLPVASEIRAVLDRLANRLATAGAQVARSSSLLPDLAESARLHTRMVRNFGAFGRPPEFFKTIRENVAALKPDDDSLKAWRARAPLLSHHEWMAAEIARARLRQQWAGLFREFDVVLCPPFAVTAFPHDEKPDQEDRTIDIDGESHPYLSLI